MRRVPVPATRPAAARSAERCSLIGLLRRRRDGRRPERPPPAAVPDGRHRHRGQLDERARHVERGVRAEIDTYEVYRGTTKVKEVPGSRHMVDVTRLSPSTTYVFTVRARDTGGRLGPPSREVRAKTPAAAAADRSAPTRPGGLRGRSGRKPGGPALLGRLDGRPGRGVVRHPPGRHEDPQRGRRPDGGRGHGAASGHPLLLHRAGEGRGRQRLAGASRPRPPHDCGHRRRTGHRSHRLPREHPPRRRGVPPRPRLDSAAHGRGGHGVPGPPGRPAGRPRWCSAGPRRATGLRTASTWDGTPESATGCGSGRSCRTAPGAGSRRSGP